MIDGLKVVLEYAPYLGAGLTFLLAVVAIVAYVIKSSFHVRLEAIKRAKPEDLPSIVGDEINKLALNAGKLEKKDQYDLVIRTLAQQERRSKRALVFSIVISFLIFFVILMQIIGSPDFMSKTVVTYSGRLTDLDLKSYEVYYPAPFSSPPYVVVQAEGHVSFDVTEQLSDGFTVHISGYSAGGALEWSATGRPKKQLVSH